MKTQVRCGVFETNSSSTHSLSITTEETYEKWKNGELLYDEYKDEFIECTNLDDSQKEEAKNYYEDKRRDYWKDWEQLTDSEKDSWYVKYAKTIENNNDGMTYDEYMYHGNLETYSRHYTSPSGDKLVIFGEYGYDG